MPSPTPTPTPPSQIMDFVSLIWAFYFRQPVLSMDLSCDQAFSTCAHYWSMLFTFASHLSFYHRYMLPIQACFLLEFIEFLLENFEVLQDSRIFECSFVLDYSKTPLKSDFKGQLKSFKYFSKKHGIYKCDEIRCHNMSKKKNSNMKKILSKFLIRYIHFIRKMRARKSLTCFTLFDACYWDIQHFLGCTTKSCWIWVCVVE